MLYDETVAGDAWLAGTVMGLLAAAILMANNVRDIDTDRASNKRTLAVMVGLTAARRLYASMLIGAFGIAIAGAVTSVFPIGALLILAAAPLAVKPIAVVSREITGPVLIGALKATARLQILCALLLAAGIII